MTIYSCVDKEGNTMLCYAYLIEDGKQWSLLMDKKGKSFLEESSNFEFDGHYYSRKENKQ